VNDQHHRGAIPKKQREFEIETSERLYLRVLEAMQDLVATDPHAGLERLAAAAASALTNSNRKALRLMVISESDGKPTCGICRIRIFLDVPEASPEAFTLDHIVRKADGGRWEPKNVRPAHKLCNELEVVFNLGRQPKKHTLQRLHDMRQRMRLRQEAEEPRSTQATGRGPRQEKTMNHESPQRLTKEQRGALETINLDPRYTPDLNEADRVEAITTDGRVAIIDIDGEIEYQPAAGWTPA
jgi:hypothetical protein